MKVLGIYGSPRKGGNTDRLLDEALKGAQSAGAEVSAIRPCDLQIAGCIECAGCDETGKCVVEDDMQGVYPQLLGAEIIILAAPMFFYGIPAQAKALIDRCQAMWCRRRLNKTPERMRQYDGGQGYLIAAGATKGANLFEGAKMTAKYFFDALDMSFEGGVYVKAVEERGAAEKRPDALHEAFELGRTAVQNARSRAGDARNTANGLTFSGLGSGVIPGEREERTMQRYVCGVCGYVYDPAVGDPENGVDAGTPFDKLPADWVCPVCGADKDAFAPE